MVEIWGINPYETYDTPVNIFERYLAGNLERTRFSLAKQEVIGDFDSIELENEDTVFDDVDFIKMNFPIVSYRDRFLDGSLTDIDFYYSFEKTRPYNSLFGEMESRLAYNGYKKSICRGYGLSQKQSHIKTGECTEIEPDIAKYIQKIIDLCKKKGVELIFYRAPYISSVNELKKLNHLRHICDENDVLFLDLESEIPYDYDTDFVDYYHLSEMGANKSTEYLMLYILNAIE